MPVVPWGPRHQGSPDQMPNLYHTVLTFERFSVGLNVTTTKKGRQLFGEKSAPPEKILATHMRKGPSPYIGMGPPGMVNLALHLFLLSEHKNYQLAEVQIKFLIIVFSY